MKASALAISLILILVPLAGCSGTDTEVNVDLSNEDINDLIDENLEDVMNNTTVVVFQEYHNNTTVINHNMYSNNTTTNVDESGASTSTTTYNYNGSSEEDIRMFTVQWDPTSYLGDVPNFQLIRPFCDNEHNNDEDSSSPCQEWDYGWDSVLGSDDNLIGNYDVSTIYVIQYNGQTVEISATCSEFYQYYRWQDDDWRDFLANNYGYSSDDIDSAASQLRNRFADYWPGQWYSWESNCDYVQSDWITLFEIDLDEGTALEFLAHPSLTMDVNCDDGFGTGIGNHSDSYLMGGQANCTISGSTTVTADYDTFGIQNYDNGSSEYEYGIELSWINHIQESFAVYFELHPVTVHQ